MGAILSGIGMFCIGRCRMGTWNSIVAVFGIGSFGHCGSHQKVYIADRDVDLLNQVLARMDSVTKSTRSTPEKILRLHSRATGLIMAKAAGAHFLPGEKPPLLMSEFRHHSSITPQQGEVYFYTPAEVRNAIDRKSVV